MPQARGHAPYIGKAARKLVHISQTLLHLDSAAWRPKAGNAIILDALQTGKPTAVGKMGTVERMAITGYIDGRDSYGWMNGGGSVRDALYVNAGVYPNRPADYRRYCRYMIEKVLPSMDVMAVVCNVGEVGFFRSLMPYARKIHPHSLETWRIPLRKWTDELADKTVLVIHPFADTIWYQYQRGFPTIPIRRMEMLAAPQHPVLVPPKHKDWFASLNWMKGVMDDTAYDVALIGAGAYSLPLAFHAKERGKIGIHLGGSTQLYFGIKGKRWDDYGWYGDQWIRPLSQDTPKGVEAIEEACYW